MHTFEIEAVPACAFCIFAVAIEILLAVVAEKIVLAGHVKRVAGFGFFNHLRDGVELLGFGKMREIAGVKEKFRTLGKRVDPRDRLPQGADHIFVWVFGKTDVAVADLYEAEIAGGGFDCIGAEDARSGNTAVESPDQTGADPRHALEKSAAVDAVDGCGFYFVFHFFSLSFHDDFAGHVWMNGAEIFINTRRGKLEG